MITKQCSCCREHKALDAFSPDPRNKDGKQRYCKPCMVIAIEKSRAKKRERIHAIEQKLPKESLLFQLKVQQLWRPLNTPQSS